MTLCQIFWRLDLGSQAVLTWRHVYLNLIVPWHVIHNKPDPACTYPSTHSFTCLLHYLAEKHSILCPDGIEIVAANGKDNCIDPDLLAASFPATASWQEAETHSPWLWCCSCTQTLPWWATRETITRVPMMITLTMELDTFFLEVGHWVTWPKTPGLLVPANPLTRHLCLWVRTATSLPCIGWSFFSVSGDIKWQTVGRRVTFTANVFISSHYNQLTLPPFHLIKGTLHQQISFDLLFWEEKLT